jgi:hypothetical protein
MASLTLDYLRSFRLGQFAIFDFVLSFVAMYWIGVQVGHPRRFLYATLPFSVLAHWTVGTDTPLTRMALDAGHYGVKVVLLWLAYQALLVDE